jgi:predicted metal-dependent peptidase
MAEFTTANKTARELITSAYVKLSSTDSALYLAALNMEPVETQNPSKTFAVKVHGGKAELLYNPNFVKTIGESANGIHALRVLLGLEAARILLMHATSRVKNNKVLSLLASNLTIKDAMRELKGFCNYEIYNSIPSYESLGIPEQTTFENYYEILMSNVHELQLKNENQNQVETESEAFDRHFDPSKNTNAENWETDEELTENIKQFIKEHIDEIKNCGSLSGALQNAIIEAAGKNEINPLTIVRRFFANIETIDTEETRSKPNRRRGWEAPGYVKTMTYHVLCGIDGSGSVSAREIEKMFIEINAMTKICEIDYVTWDVQVYEKSLEKGKKYKMNNKFKFNASKGGTTPECLFHFAKKRKYKNVVVLTDGEFSDFTLSGKFNICWITTSRISEFMKNTGKIAELKKWR